MATTTRTRAAAKSAAAKPASARRKGPGRTRPPKDDIPPLEWISAAVGLLCALVAIGFVGWDALVGERSPPSIEVRLVAVTPTPHGFVAEVEAINHGGSPAAQVAIEGVLSGQGEPETAQATLDYIPEQSRADGGLVFEHDPRVGRLVLRAKGFADAS
ncbi:hypothetical protein [Caulobacter endophyticus]|uniref:hypothetical protein n=1 Tax=Caulobacter endophyticus TaxID=2172652 RepID=UPI00240FB088|nr:hypothetical protein [Caulobacter endophyticus]MDG2530303.1 hypothetical protein [Caulobacter endophyticus]